MGGGSFGAGRDIDEALDSGSARAPRHARDCGEGAHESANKGADTDVTADCGEGRNSAVDEIRNRALGLLVRREHSRFELLGKLTRRGFDAAACERVLDALIAENALSDERFAEVYVNYRRERGFGPLRIREELRRRGIAAALRDEWCASKDAAWSARARALRDRRFGEEAPTDYRQRARQARFLTQRGFTAEQVSAALG